MGVRKTSISNKQVERNEGTNEPKAVLEAELRPAELRAKIEELSASNNRLKDENQKLREECQRTRKESNLWRKKFCRRDVEARKFEQLVGLRDSQITLLKEELKKVRASNQKLQKIIHSGKSEESSVEELAETVNESGQTSQSKPEEEKGSQNAAKRAKRGKQPGAPGYGRKQHEGVPLEEEREHTVKDFTCADCGETMLPVGNEESSEVDVELRVFRRKHIRQKCGHYCKIKGKWVTKTAPPAPKVFPKSGYGIGFWIYTLLSKYYLHQPTNRLRKQFKHKGLSVSQGTITNGHQKIHEQIKPLIKEIKRYSRTKNHWHIDDTGWKVFVPLKGKEGFKWYLWVFLSSDVCVYVLDPSRARDVPKAHLKDCVGVVTSDRLGANRKLGEDIQSSFCWVHIRRDLLEVAAAYPEVADTCLEILMLIGAIFHFNAERLLHEPSSRESTDAENKLRQTLDTILLKMNEHLEKESLHSELRRAFSGVVKDWKEMTLFFDLPAIPPHNNPAEQALRGAVCGRNGYYGSFAKWSAEFTADMFTLIQTLVLNDVDPEQFLTEYLTACANNGGTPPSNARDFLPWRKKKQDLPRSVPDKEERPQSAEKKEQNKTNSSSAKQVEPKTKAPPNTDTKSTPARADQLKQTSPAAHPAPHRKPKPQRKKRAQIKRTKSRPQLAAKSPSSSARGP